LPELLAAEHDGIFVVEGEKCADALANLRLATTTNPGGACNWVTDLNPYFKDKSVYILPDNDAKGAKHARDVATHLFGIAREIRIVNLPGLPHTGDVVDWLEAGGTVHQLCELVKQAPPLTAEDLEPQPNPEQPHAEAPQEQPKADDQQPKADDQGAEQQANQPRYSVTSAEFLAGFVPPDYLIDGLLQRGFVYSFTGPTGSGKTSVALLWSAHIALGKKIGEYSVEKGRVLYLAGENPDDIRMRWMAMAHHIGFDIDTIDVRFVPGVFKLSEIGARIIAEIKATGEVALVIIDTSAAFFEGDAENDSVQLGNHARLLRSLVTHLPGRPSGLINCHPVKNAAADNLLPRGGGAFLAEVDGNLTCWKNDSLATVHAQGKFRGPDFAPIPFALKSVTAPDLKDSKGRQIPTVIAVAIGETEQKQAEASSRDDENAVLMALPAGPLSMTALAQKLGWRTRTGQPDKRGVNRVAKRLKQDKLLTAEREGLKLTPKGEKEGKRVEYNVKTAGAKYG
jgi:AAA domain-containing protein